MLYLKILEMPEKFGVGIKWQNCSFKFRCLSLMSDCTPVGLIAPYSSQGFYIASSLSEGNIPMEDATETTLRSMDDDGHLTNQLDHSERTDITTTLDGVAGSTPALVTQHFIYSEESIHQIGGGCCCKTLKAEPSESWWLLSRILLFNMLSAMNFSSFGLLYIEYTNHFTASKAEIGWIISIQMACGTLTGMCCASNLHPVSLIQSCLSSIIMNSSI